LEPKAIVEALSKLENNGVLGKYVFDQASHTVKDGEDFLPVPAAQIQNGKSKVFWPASMATTKYQSPQITKPFLEMSTLENVIVGSYFGSHEKSFLKKCQQQAEEILLLAGLADKHHVLASQLTLVERKRLELARVLSTQPSIVLLDEVVAGLNPTEAMEMVELIKKIRAEGMTILMIEHVMKAIMGVSDRVIVLNYGQKIAEGTPEEIVANQEVIEAYLGGKADAHSG
jgi:ABC-type branched-subunit amino acid transport system ATPase component